MRKIVFIDDEPYRAETYNDILNISFFNKEIKFFSKISKAREYININSYLIDLIILDLMFAGIEENNHDTGKDAGIFFYYEIKKLHSDIPIIILTNRRLNELFVIDIMKYGDISLDKAQTVLESFIEQVKISIKKNL
jgi:DNA-binding NarL/FixJ family response regulator